MGTDDMPNGTAAEEPRPWTGWSVRPKDAEELWSFIGAATFGLGTNNRVVWRGLPSSAFDISSSLVREVRISGILTEQRLRAREVEILTLARRWDIGLAEHGSASDLHLLAKLQHHGAPTRLIDVTYNPLTALWFACADVEQRNEDGVLAVISVTDMPERISSELPKLTYDTVPVPWTASLVSALRKARKASGAILVEPRPRDDRMKAQEGLFLTGVIPETHTAGPISGLRFSPLAKMLSLALPSIAHGTATTNGQEFNGLAVAGIVISPALKEQLLPILDRTFNRSQRTMYPDIPGFVDAYKKGLFGDEFLAMRATPDIDAPKLPEYWNDPEVTG